MGIRMSELKFRIHVWEGQGGYLVGQCVELLENMKEAIVLVLEDLEREFQETHPHVTIEEMELITIHV